MNGSETTDAQDNPAPEPLPAGEAAEQLAAAKKEAVDNHDRYLRTAADLENFRRRTAREREELRLFAASRLLEDLLPACLLYTSSKERAQKGKRMGFPPRAFWKSASEAISGQWITSRTVPSPSSMFQFMRRAPFSGRAMNVEPPTRQRIRDWPKYGIFSMEPMKAAGPRGATRSRKPHLMLEKSNWIRS